MRGMETTVRKQENDKTQFMVVKDLSTCYMKNGLKGNMFRNKEVIWNAFVEVWQVQTK